MHPHALEAIHPAQPGSKTIHSVQLLRFVAAALVVLSHARMEFGLQPFGGVGVDIFFVISGFIIYHVTRSSSEHFFTRRLIRIVPLYWTGTLVLALVAVLMPSLLNNVQFDAARLLSSLLFFPQWNEVNGNFHPILLLGWTLNYEMLFYLVFYAAMRVSHRHRFALCSAVLIALALSGPTSDPQSAHMFWSDTITLEFIFGMGIGVVAERTRFVSRAGVPSFFVLLGLATYCLILHPATGLVAPPSWRFLAVGLPSAALVILVLACEASLRSHPIVVTRIIDFLGDLSYSTYIFHVYVIGLLKRVVGLEMGIHLYLGLLFAATYLLAALAYFTVESPARSHLTRIFIGGASTPPLVATTAVKTP